MHKTTRLVAGFLIVSGVMACVPTPAVAIVNGTEPDAADTRFDAVCGFGFTSRLNGVDQEHGTTCSGTLIAPDRVVLARHCIDLFADECNLPTVPRSVRFRRNPDMTVGSIDQGWESFYQVSVIGYTFAQSCHVDIVIAHLSEPVTHITPIPMGNPCEDLCTGDDIIIAGWGEAETGGAGNGKGVLRYIHTVASSLSGTTINYPLWTDMSNPCACGIANHDSGSPILIEYPPSVKGGEPELRIVGVVATTNSGWHIGRHEYFGLDCMIPPLPPCLGDLNGDRTIDTADLGILIANFGNGCQLYGNIIGDCGIDAADLTALANKLNTECDGCPEDLNGDGFVNASDLGILNPLIPTPCEEDLTGDLNYDCIIDTADLGILIANFGIDCGCESSQQAVVPVVPVVPVPMAP